MLEEMHKNFPILIIDDELGTPTPGGRALQEIIDHLKSLEYAVIKTLTLSDGRLAMLSHEDAGCVLLDWDIKPESGDYPSTPAELISFIRGRNVHIPIFLLSERLKVEDIPLDVMNRVNGYIWKEEDSPAFIAGRIEEAAKQYLSYLLPPFFGELAKYVDEYKYAWHTPGHMGGLAFMKSPAGKVFFDFFGENIFRSDLSVSVPELGSLMEHSGVVGDAEREAARIFGADKTYFVTNGTSTANRIVFNGCVAPGDIVLVDRNCHKSVIYAIILTGAIPVYLMPTRNDYGIIGPIHMDEFDKDTIRKKLENNPLIKDPINHQIKLAVVTNSTYDGLCYNVDFIKDKLANIVKFLHFDEAWYGYARFHPLYRKTYAMSAETEKAEHPILFATQSTHKVLAAFSQASMIHMRQRHKREDERIEYDQFNEAFMMHTSTSPQYGIIASLDVAAKMMEGEAGKSLVTEAIEEGIIFRWKMAQLAEEIMKKESGEKQWWFEVWQPEKESKSPAEQMKALRSKPESENFKKGREYWTLKPGGTWHGFEGMEKDYILLDPIKVTILTPGINEDGSMSSMGIPASIVSAFLRNRGIVVEKTGFYSFLVLFTIGITKGKSGTLLSELFAFKRVYDNNESLENVFPNLTKEFPEAYKTMGLQNLCTDMHEYLKKKKIATTIKDVYAKIPQMVMTPAEAYRSVIHGEVEKVRIADLIGKTAAVMVVPYPPGIPIWMPGEKLTQETKDICDYLAIYEDFDNRYPGFETEIHGIIIKEENKRKVYSIYCLKE